MGQDAWKWKREGEVKQVMGQGQGTALEASQWILELGKEAGNWSDSEEAKECRIQHCTCVL